MRDYQKENWPNDAFKAKNRQKRKDSEKTKRKKMKRKNHGRTDRY